MWPILSAVPHRRAHDVAGSGPRVPAWRRTQSALLVLVPEADPVVDVFRRRLDEVADRGVSAHVTTIYPFVDADALDAAVLERVAGVASAHAPFDYRFAETAWFPGTALYLAPDDPAPFRLLTEAMAREFPQHPPYGGEFDEIMPHVTVARWTDDEDLGAVETTVRRGLPVSGRATHLTLMTEDAAGRWSAAHRFPLGS